MLILSGAEVAQLLPVAEAIELVRAAFVSYSRGEIVCPTRLSLPLRPPGAVLLSMPAFDGHAYAGVKLASVQPENAGRDLPVVRASYQLLDAVTGEPLALMGATRLTAIRTGAAGGVAADLLALPGADTLALIGAGAQAETQLLAALAVRPLRRVRVYSRDPRHVAAFIARLAPRVRAELLPASSAEQAVEGAQIVVTATNANAPVFEAGAVHPGTHITAVGAFTSFMQEIPDEIVARAGIYVDAEEAAWLEAGELAGPLARGLIAARSVRGEIGALAEGRIEGRGSAEEITLFKSVGLAAQDLACAVGVYRRAREAGIGVHATL